MNLLTRQPHAMIMKRCAACVVAVAMVKKSSRTSEVCVLEIMSGFILCVVRTYTSV